MSNLNSSSSSKYPLDAVDQKILSHLVHNARTPFLEIARECGISGAAIHQRVKKLEETGIIVGSQFIVQPEALGYNVCAFVGIQLTEVSKYSEVVPALKNISEVVECHYVTGDFVVLLKIYCKDNNHLLSVLSEKIQKIQGISNTNTFVSLDRAFERQVIVRQEANIKSSKKLK